MRDSTRDNDFRFVEMADREPRNGATQGKLRSDPIVSRRSEPEMTASAASDKAKQSVDDQITIN